MRKAFLREHGKSGIELIEEGVVLLRSCPLGILATYYLGSVPFAAGFLIFCADLGGRGGAENRLGWETLTLTVLFVWMKFFQARFAGNLLLKLRGGTEESFTPGRAFRSLCVQTIGHSAGLVVLPLAAIAFLPFGWACAFFQNLSALDDGRTRLRDLAQSAWQQARLWPAQNHTLLTLLSLFAVYVLLNWITLGLVAPHLFKMFFGMESIFTQSPMSLLNTTFFAATVVLTYLSVDPLLKACYVLRCFYGGSLKSGDDLRMEVRRLSVPATILAACLFFSFVTPAISAEKGPAPVAEAELDRSISHVIQQEKYTWRVAPEEKVVEKNGLFSGFFRSALRVVGEALETFAEFLRKILEWIFGRERDSASPGLDPGWMAFQNVFLFSVLALVAGGLAVAAMRILNRRRSTVSVRGTAIGAVPDLEDETTSADELPEDEWVKMGKQLQERGEYRPALRAFYLAGLSHLASRGLVTITRFKSNRDYERELGRRGHFLPEIPVLFQENVTAFERVWYGLHEANAELVRGLAANLEKMKGIA